MITFLGASFAILSLVIHCQGENCLPGKYHKSSPGPEPGMSECQRFSQSSCCFSNYTEQLAVSPLTRVNHVYWDRCSPLSSRCEVYMKKVDCFYHCSPIAFNWINPNNSYAILNVPICENYCDDWFAACINDQTCVRNWISGWEWDEHGNYCRNECIPYHQMYRNGKDLCESMWGTSFKVTSSPCNCLMMDHDDNNVIQHLQLHDSGTSSPTEALDTENKDSFCQRRQKSLRERKEERKKQQAQSS